MTWGSLRASSEESRFILRAELRRGDDVVISYAFDLTERSAFVATDWIADVGAKRFQFHHVIDIVPTILDVLEISEPTIIDGVAQKPPFSA